MQPRRSHLARSEVRRSPAALAPLIALAVWLLATCCGGAAPGETAPAARTADGAGGGFAVWESNRQGGSWRIWLRPLPTSDSEDPGSGEEGDPPARPLSPLADERQHCCPHISPDGRRVAYLRYRAPARVDGRWRRGTLHVATLDDDLRVIDDRAVAEGVPVPSEHRVAVWRDSASLIHVDDGGFTRLLALGGSNTGATRDQGGPASDEPARRLTAEGRPEASWLVDATLSHATSGHPSFSPFDRASGRIAERRPFGGCQPYFSDDGRWGFWVAGAGGPIHRIDLASRAVAPLVAKNDPRLPADRGYLYFPMLARSGLMLAFGASGGEHDFNRADYDIFALPTDPATLMPVGEAIRISRHPATDRFPDVYLPPLALGRHTGEAPFTAHLELPPDHAAGAGTTNGGGWSWSPGDGSAAVTSGGSRFEHRYERPGSYEVLARPVLSRAAGDGGADSQAADRTALRGEVRVRPAAPPRLLAVDQRGELRVLLRFDEPIATGDLAIGLRGDRPDEQRGVESARVGDDPATLEVLLASPLERPWTLLLRGLTDRADVPNRLAELEVALSPPSWPADRRGLLFLFEDGDAPNLVPMGSGDGGGDEEGGERSWPLEPTGPARLDRFYRLQPAGGAWTASPEAAAAVAEAARQANELSFEVTLGTPPGGKVDRPAELIHLGRPGRSLLRLTAEGDRLLLRLRTAELGPRGEPDPLDLGPLPAPSGGGSGGSLHLAVSYFPGRLAVYRDGERTLLSELYQGGFFHWQGSQRLAFGNAPPPDRSAPFLGTLETIAIYDRVLGEDEVAEGARRVARRLADRAPVPRLRLEATLTAKAELPTLDQIAPYTRALAVYEYRVEEVLQGEAVGDTIRVAHWVLLDGERQPAAGRRIGERYRLLVEPFGDNPQLASHYLSEAGLAPRYDLPLYFDTR